MKHGMLALTFHVSFDSRIVCSKCFQFMKPGSFALHCGKCNKQAVPSKKDIKHWTNSDKKWASLKRENPDDFADKTVVKIAQRDGLSAYVVHLHLYLGKTSSTMKLKAICITDGCAHVCALNALHRHFKQSHMDATYMIRDMGVVKAPALNDVKEDGGELEEEDYDGEAGNETGHGTTQEDMENPSDKGVVDKVAKMHCEEAQKEGDANVDKAEEENHCAPEVKALVQVSEITNATEATMNTPDVAEVWAAGLDTQDMDCEPFEASNGPSDDDTAVEQEKKKETPIPTEKRRKSANNKVPLKPG
jgi:hypothetical protein